MAAQTLSGGVIGAPGAAVTITMNWDDATNQFTGVTVVVDAGRAPITIALRRANGNLIAAQTFQPGTSTTLPITAGMNLQRFANVRDRLAPIVVIG